MNRDRLYRLAFEFKATKLWKKIWDTQLFAVKHSDGNIGYCCVWGMMGDPSLMVFPEDGLEYVRAFENPQEKIRPWSRHEIEMRREGVCCAFKSKKQMPPKNIDEMQEYCRKNNIKLRGANACPSLEKLEKYRMPWYPDDGDAVKLEEALEAAIEVARRLEHESDEETGLPDGAPFDREIPLLSKEDGAFRWSLIALPPVRRQELPSPRITDEFMLARIKKKNRAGVWNCAIIMHPQAMTEEDIRPGEPTETAPHYPLVFIQQDGERGSIVRATMIRDLEQEAGTLCAELMKSMEEAGRPMKINACDARTRDIISAACEQVGVHVEYEPENALMNDALNGYYHHFGGPTDWDAPDLFYPDDAAGDPMESLAELESMIVDPRILGEMPDDILKELMHMLIERPLDREVTLAVVDEWTKRFLK